ncbi:MAG TPA: AAA family ATPase, partial [Bryobacteraceae bacterium]
MITRVEANQYRCFRSMNQDLGPFHVLVGPNGSGKSTFLDVIAFLGTLMSQGQETAIDERSENFHDLVWGREGSCFDLAIEALIPEEKRVTIGTQKSYTIRYEVAVRIEPNSDAVVLSKENLIVMSVDRSAEVSVITRESTRTLFQPEDS